MERKTIGTFLSALRKANGMTQRQLADKLHVSDKAVSRWERDESAPDLTLIPVIADLFSITSDELLRGERSGNQTGPESNAINTEKQIRYLLNRTLSRHKIYCCISGTVALLGLIAAILLNQIFFKANLGFFVSLAFFIIAALCQIIFLILGHSAIDPEENHTRLIAPIKKAMILASEIVFGIILLLFSSCLPLIVFPIGPFHGLGIRSWLIYGSCFALSSAILWCVVCIIFNRKRGLWQKIDWHSPANRLRLQWLKKTALLLMIIIPLYIASVTLVSQNYHLFVRGQQFDTWDDFRRCMETPKDTDGTPLAFLSIEGTGDETAYLYENQAGNPVALRKEDISRILYGNDSDDTELVRYRHLNRQITSVHLNRGNLPVQVFTAQQLLSVQIITAFVHLFWILAMLSSLWILLRRYRTEKAKQ